MAGVNFGVGEPAYNERMRLLKTLALLCIAAAGFTSCSTPRETDPVAAGTASDQLKPLGAPVPADFVHRTVYVSVYSSIYLGIPSGSVRASLAATVSIRNISPEHSLIVTGARYFDSTGKEFRNYVSVPSALGRMATAEFVVRRDSNLGGPGANFLIDWWGPADMDDPIIEAVMIGQNGTASYSFTSVGRTLKRPAP